MVLRRRPAARFLAAATVVFFGVLGSPPPAATANPGPGRADLPSAAAASIPPAGANVWSCRPTARHPRPVILVHGTGMDMRSWGRLSPALQREGYCVFALDYGGSAGVWGRGDIRASARELAGFVDVVRARTGAAQVDVVGHSQGGTMTRQYLRFEGGADPADPSRNKIRSLVMLGPTTHGTTFGGLQTFVDAFTSLRLTDEPTNEWLADLGFGVATYQQMIGSRFLSDLNAGRETMPGVDYRVIASRSDTVVTPPEGSFLVPAPGSSVLNQWIQDSCPAANVSHVGLLDDPRSIFLVRRALDPGLPGAVPC
ncbi:esterase/lipase family protein [Rhodococcus parequi]|uniref:esterase/lipase family protein n=1 Tax=Rhodococcus parequi TaxID=3137122 RepID=UPI003B3A9C15